MPSILYEPAASSPPGPIPAPGPVLVPSQPRSPQQANPLVLWHLLSLDAPSVAALWTWLIARCSGVILPWTSTAAMFLAVWMLYAADRLLDVRNAHVASELEQRHHFHRNHQPEFLAGVAVVSVLLAILLPGFTHAELRLFAALGSLLFAYFFLIHLWPFGAPAKHARNARLPKELAVGIFFPAAVFIPTVARAPRLRPELLPVALLFASVCTLNCLYVYRWEHPGRPRSAHWTTQIATRHLTTLCIATLTIAVALGIAYTFTQALDAKLRLPLAACSLSACILFALHRNRSALRPVLLRALADAALLTPLLALPWLLLR